MTVPTPTDTALKVLKSREKFYKVTVVAILASY